MTANARWLSRLGVCGALLWLVSHPAPLRADIITCSGDCNADGEVTIDEIIHAVKISLGGGVIADCAAFNSCVIGTVCIDGLISAVSHALTTCPVTAQTTGIVFNGEENRLSAYEPGPVREIGAGGGAGPLLEGSYGFLKQVVVPSNADLPGGVGRDINAQICFTRNAEGKVHFIAGEDTNQGRGHDTAGWGYFELTGTEVGSLNFEEVGKLIPTYQPTADGAENYGCGFLRDGRLLTTDVGNQAGGPGNGQLIIWFPSLETGATYTDHGVEPVTPAHYCKLDIAIGTAQQIAVDADDRIYVGSSRENGAGEGAGVYRYTGPFPTSDTPAGGCDGMDSTGAPMATHVTKERFIPSSSVIPTPAGVVIKPGGGFYVSSVLNGSIGEFDADGTFVRRVLTASNVGIPIASGTPLGIGLGSDGTIYYADIGLRIGGGGIGPGNRTGTVRRIRFVNGEPQLPETMDTGRNFPDGIGWVDLSANQP